MSFSLRPYQEEAVNNLKTGSILNGGVGTGKTLTSLCYYIKEQGGDYHPESWKPMVNPKRLYIITTARKRDTLEWEADAAKVLLAPDDITVDSWNNIAKYVDVEDGFFIFDEQRLVSYGAWTKSFLKIVRKGNPWILLSATPGDCWQDYMPVFIANGFYRNKTDFQNQHVIYDPYCKNYPRVKGYQNTGKLIKYRRQILVNMDYIHDVKRVHENIAVSYPVDSYKAVMKTRWNIYKEEPIRDAAGLCNVLRKLINSDSSRIEACLNVIDDHKKVIIFYNYDFELELLRQMCEVASIPYSEWNGHKHEPILKSKDTWVYLVQYTAGAEGWNCTDTNCIIFYSQNYSYKIMQQAAGRIDRLNTPFDTLYYYHLKSTATIDTAIYQTLKQKQRFNENSFCSIMFEPCNMAYPIEECAQKVYSTIG